MKTRKVIEVSESFHKRWLGYAAAAGAAGVGVLGSAQPAKADIIYTRADIAVSGSATLNMDGVGAVSLSNAASFHSVWVDRSFFLFSGGARMGVAPIDGLVVGGVSNAARLPLGAFIGSYANGGFGFGGSRAMASVRGNFGVTSRDEIYYPGRGWRSRFFNFRHPFAASYTQGEWATNGTGYLGFMFAASDGFHYGWASIDVHEAITTGSVSYQEVVGGYAYNTVPGQSILAGQGITPTPEPGTLGLLAIGSLGLGLWRRRKAVGSEQ